MPGEPELGPTRGDTLSFNSTAASQNPLWGSGKPRQGSVLSLTIDEFKWIKRVCVIGNFFACWLAFTTIECLRSRTVPIHFPMKWSGVDSLSMELSPQFVVTSTNDSATSNSLVEKEDRLGNRPLDDAVYVSEVRSQLCSPATRAFGSLCRFALALDGASDSTAIRFRVRGLRPLPPHRRREIFLAWSFTKHSQWEGTHG